MLSLIPAKFYYDDATQDQWQLKKKLKKEALKDRIAKLDPESAASADSYSNGGASAKDVMENRAKSAKKAVVPGQVEPKDQAPKEPKEPKEPTEKEEILIQEGEGLVFDDEGNDVEAQVPPKTQKKQLSPEEQEARKQRRAQLREKLATKINTMREKRRAPGTKNGGPLRSRELMLAERKKKQELKKQEKKRKREEEDEESDDDKSDDDKSDDEDSAVLFGNIVFQDGSRVTSDLSRVRNGVDQKKKKGPANKDIKAHLVKLEAKKRKLAELSPEEQSIQKEKDLWKSLMSQAEGVKVKDDEKLLKRTLKRKEKQKLKSEIEWKERKQVVKDTSAARQKRREANLKQRRENKGKKSKNQVRLKKFTGVVHKGGSKDGKKDGKKRAGFEGSAKSKGKRK